MSYVTKHIGQDDRVSYIAHKHWIVYVTPALLVFLYGIGIPLLLVAWLSKRGTELAVTNKKVIGKWGIVSRSTIEQRLEKVDSIQVHQGILGRMLNYGTVTVHGSGMTSTPIPMISDPIQFRKQVEIAIDALKTVVRT
jgi:uncharacterized membrane protein YdbT with pleckstrin-like domain